MLAARLRTEGFECFVPHEQFPELADVTVEEVYRIDTEGLRSADALVAWLDGATVDDGTACEIGMFAELARTSFASTERFAGRCEGEGGGSCFSLASVLWECIAETVYLVNAFRQALKSGFIFL